MDNIRILVADGHPLYCEAIAALLQGHGGFEIACHVSDGNALVEQARQLAPDLILMDASLPPSGGLEVTRRLRAEKIGCKVLLLTRDEDALDFMHGFGAGVNGFISKNAGHADLLSAISSVSRGECVIHLSVTPQVVQDYVHGVRPYAEPDHDDLSTREREILSLVAEGLRTRDIATRLGIAAQTVSGHRARIMKKLRVHGQTEMVKYALMGGLVGGLSEAATLDPDTRLHS